MIVSPGVKPKRGETKAEALRDLMLGSIETVYRQAVTTGYDMGHSVFAPHEDQ